MKRNNFDKSSTGIDIEALVMYDTDIAQHDFESNFEVLQHEGYRNNTVAYYMDYGNVKGADSITFTIKGDKACLIKYAHENLRGYDEVQEPSEKDVEDIKHDIAYELKPTVLNYEALNEYDLKDTGLAFEPDRPLVRVSICGYSQGDYAEVIYCPTDLEKAWGNAPIESDLCDMFTHYFYDAPVYAVYTINGKEYSYHDMPTYDRYEWKRDEFLDYVAKESGMDRETLEPYCPQYLNYP